MTTQQLPKIAAQDKEALKDAQERLRKFQNGEPGKINLIRFKNWGLLREVETGDEDRPLKFEVTEKGQTLINTNIDAVDQETA